MKKNKKFYEITTESTVSELGVNLKMFDRFEKQF